jgi:hypothetical protein
MPSKTKRKPPPFRPTCAHCGERFEDLDTWYFHRRGPLDARRCLTEREMRRVELRKSVRGYWVKTTEEQRKQVSALKKRVHEETVARKSSPPGD